jgi:transposase
MTYSAVVVGPERRRRFTEDQKLAILAAAFAPGARVTDVARQADICTGVIYRWRRTYMAGSGSGGFAQAVVVDAQASGGSHGAEPAMVVEFSGGARVSIAAGAPAGLVTAALHALR